MAPEMMTDITITIVIFLVSIGMAFKGKILRETKKGTSDTSTDKVQNRGTLFLMCGSVVAIIQIIKLGSFLL
ncbi:hypothetical protein JL49_08325 [Pseudoalteromonas luteoviolacea]|uniref:Uncharacterized protein n=1 Tax=Pseudoalteromonas luteoviolacea NCIMB 1942 TaxID=1365253 RepID=A0A166ZDR1_9GAMM|nr:hypothetical protein N482_17580 [Pseudoalteromonas luteoviolacea NCIMB 1942]KZX00979.1 hypothetical protein JL49_08325 [Pseudoalteromonas luteoviolacea]